MLVIGATIQRGFQVKARAIQNKQQHTQETTTTQQNIANMLHACCTRGAFIYPSNVLHLISVLPNKGWMECVSINVFTMVFVCVICVHRNMEVFVVAHPNQNCISAKTIFNAGQAHQFWSCSFFGWINLQIIGWNISHTTWYLRVEPKLWKASIVHRCLARGTCGQCVFSA